MSWEIARKERRVMREIVDIRGLADLGSNPSPIAYRLRDNEQMTLCL